LADFLLPTWRFSSVFFKKTPFPSSRRSGKLPDISFDQEDFIMKKNVVALLATFGLAWAQPITFDDFDAIWVCKGDNWIATNRLAKKVRLSNDRLGIDSWLHYDAGKDLYRSRDGRHTIEYRGNNLEDAKVSFIIDGKSRSCFYEYMERE
jgi:hypothetical protein